MNGRALELKAYDPLQPRQPRGTEHGGEWTRLQHARGPFAPRRIEVPASTSIHWGGDWSANPAARAEAETAVGMVLARFDVPLKAININPDAREFHQLAGKSKDTVYVSPDYLDDEFMRKRQADWGSVSIRVPDDPFGRKAVVIHELGHVLDGVLLHQDRQAYDKLDAFLNERGSYGMPGERTRLQAGLEAPSAYGTENRYEFVAEALTDWVAHGEGAHPSSQWIGRLFESKLGRS